MNTILIILGVIVSLLLALYFTIPASRKYVKLFSQIFFGIVFIYSGFVKAVDPLGSTYKFIDYFEAFGMNWANFTAFPLAILLSAAEFIIGVSLLLGIKTRIFSWGAILFMGVFTPLTLVLAIDNPVSDCGCFGDALILTNWETFWKNIIILVPTFIVFIERNKIKSFVNKKWQWTLIVLNTLLITSVSIHCYQHLPFIDFRPYEIGNNITEGMTIPEDAPQAEFDYILTYEKNGQEEDFAIDKIPDSTWSWVKTETIEISKGYEPPIHDFSISSEEKGDITDLILEDEKYNFLLIAYDLTKSDTEKQKEINSIAHYCLDNNYNFICLTSSLEKDIQEYASKNTTPYPFYNTDPITLKTIVRSNPGLVLLKKGTVVDKWHCNDLPDLKEIESKYLEN